jgi:DNA-binding HxlR family transcriptional regulator
MKPSPTLLALSRFRWNIPVTAVLHRTGGAAFGGLVDRLSVSRDSLSRTLTFLGGRGWVRQRRVREPPYVLSASGRRIAAPCCEILTVAEDAGTVDTAFRRWTLPVAGALEGWSLRFAELRAMLPGITPRALTLALKEMQSAGLVEREVVGGFPPSAEYRLTKLGERHLPPLLGL